MKEREKREQDRKKENERERDLYVGYCSLTAPLLNFKQEPWAEQRAEERAEERKARKDREASGRENKQQANTGG